MHTRTHTRTHAFHARISGSAATAPTFNPPNGTFTLSRRSVAGRSGMRCARPVGHSNHLHTRACAAACAHTLGNAHQSCLTRTVPLCTAFALGDAISKACPPGFFRLDADPDSCEIAATAANRAYAGVKALSYYPFGCYWHTFTDRVYFNGYSGAIEAETYAQPLCAGTAGARAGLVHAATRTGTHANMHFAARHKHSSTRASTTFRSQNAASEMHTFQAQPPAHARMRTHPRRHTMCPAIVARARMGRGGGGHGDSADVQLSERYRPRMQCGSGSRKLHAR